MEYMGQLLRAIAAEIHLHSLHVLFCIGSSLNNTTLIDGKFDNENIVFFQCILSSFNSSLHNNHIFEPCECGLLASVASKPASKYALNTLISQEIDSYF